MGNHRSFPFTYIIGIILIAGVVLFAFLYRSVEKPWNPAAAQPAESQYGIEMVFVRGGTFMMGCTPEQEDGGCLGDESPAHEVTLSDFYIGKYEVTQTQWKAIMGAGDNPSAFKGDTLPVERVSWDEVQEFIERLNGMTGANYQLPTEAEWEYAARGGGQSLGYRYSGSGTIDDVAWYKNNSGYKTHPVGTKKANELGIHDMSGNVAEWVYDRYSDYSGDPQVNPEGSGVGSFRVVRGGSWYREAWGARVSIRDFDYADARGGNMGFRLYRNSR
jgi:formylglycine-generating enzyme required for sulfatase activity